MGADRNGLCLVSAPTPAATAKSPSRHGGLPLQLLFAMAVAPGIRPTT